VISRVNRSAKRSESGKHFASTLRITCARWTLWDIGEAMLPEPRRELGKSGPLVRIRVRVISNVERPVGRSPPASGRLKLLLVLCSKRQQPLAPCNGG
jgi:hypothetical protein